MLIDPISDMLTRIRNAAAVGKSEVVCPLSRVKYEIAKILEGEGYLEKAEKIGKPAREIKMTLKYINGEPAINHLVRISKSARRVYVSYKDIPRFPANRGLVIISTSSGIMAGKEAKSRHLGGELICEVH